MRRVNLADPEFEYDPDDPPGFRAGVVRTRPAVDARHTGVSLYSSATAMPKAAPATTSLGKCTPT